MSNPALQGYRSKNHIAFKGLEEKDWEKIEEGFHIEQQKRRKGDVLTASEYFRMVFYDGLLAQEKKEVKAIS